MIAANAQLRIKKIALCNIVACEYQERYPERVTHYVALLKAHPEAYAGFLSLTPSGKYEGLYELLDGYHRYCASILVGRKDVLCVVIEEPKS